MLKRKERTVKEEMRNKLLLEDGMSQKAIEDVPVGQGTSLSACMVEIRGTGGFLFSKTTQTARNSLAMYSL